MAHPCSIADAMALVGSRWSLLVLRDLVYGRHRFGEIAAATGAPRDVLTVRLRELEAAGLVHRVRYSERPPRFEYHLTDAGAELGPVLLLLARWGERWAGEEGAAPPVEFRHHDHVLDERFACATCGELVEPGTVSARSTVGLWEGDAVLGAATAATG